jgi:hypothetical protein
MICPRDWKYCIDDCCTVSCIRGGGFVMQRCDYCGNPYSDEEGCSYCLDNDDERYSCCQDHDHDAD